VQRSLRVGGSCARDLYAARRLLYADDQGDARYERAAVRWLGRVCLERPEVSLADLELASTALHALPTHRLSAQYLENEGLHHAYAVTAHRLQGATVDRTFVLGSDELYREWGYTALSRHRDSAHYYTIAEQAGRSTA
jgi:hypothetical protein